MLKANKTSDEKFTAAYIETALWSSTDDDGKPLDSGDYELSEQAKKQLTEDAMDFYSHHGIDIDDPAQGGHDFWLTRNRHGAGFWDRGLGELGQELTKAAHAYGSCDLYVGDDGLIYAS
jgi:hypothetical protein